MARSGSTDFTITGDQLIKDALIDLGVIASEDTPPAHLIIRTRRQLNIFLKFLNTKGLQLWKKLRIMVFLEKDKQRYLLGPTGDYVADTLDVIKTTVSIAAASGVNSLTLTSTTGMVIGDYIALEQDDGSLHKTTMSNIVGLVVTLGAVTTAAISAEKKVYTFTSKIARPIKLVYARAEDSAGNSRPVRMISEEEYERFGRRDQSSKIVELHFRPTLDNAELFVYQPSDNVIDELHLIVQLPVQDIDTATDEFDFPVEWMLAVQKGLAYHLGPSFGVKGEQLYDIRDQYRVALDEVSGWDTEDTNLQIIPEFRGLYNGN
jgi:hypothetical protein